MTRTIDITPDTHLLDSFKVGRTSRNECIAELIDNAWDAGATAVRIKFAKNSIQMEDNGKGLDDVTLIFQLGKHHHRTSTQSGRYGVGFKTAALILAKKATVQAWGVKTFSEATVDWGAIASSGEWSVKSDAPVPNTGLETGMRITLSGVYRPMGKVSVEKLADHLGDIYRQPLNKGVLTLTIEHEGREFKVAGRSQPKLQHAVGFERTVRGLKYVLYAGVLEGESKDGPGLCVFYGGRRIQKFPPPKGADQFYATVVLFDGPKAKWILGVNKTELHDAKQREALIEDIHKQCAGLIRQAKTTSWILPGLSLFANIPMAAPKGASVSGKTSGGGKSGTSKKSTSNSGSALTRGGICVSVMEKTDPNEIGEFAQGTVWLNLTNPFVKMCLEDKAKHHAALAVLIAFIIHRDAVKILDPEVRRRAYGILSELEDQDLDKTAVGQLLNFYLTNLKRAS